MYLAKLMRNAGNGIDIMEFIWTFQIVEGFSVDRINAKDLEQPITRTYNLVNYNSMWNVRNHSRHDHTKHYNMNKVVGVGLLNFFLIQYCLQELLFRKGGATIKSSPLTAQGFPSTAVVSETAV